MQAAPSRLPRRRQAQPLPLPGPRQGRQSGLILLALLIMLVLVGIGTLGAAEVWSVTLKREREAELLFVGDQYRRAIASYWKVSPGRRAYPPSIDVLLTDDRFPTPVHHLRRRYRDPMTESGEFEPIMQANAVVGIHTTSEDVPIKLAGFPQPYKLFEQAENYSQWQFVFVPGGATQSLIPQAGQVAPPLLPPPPQQSGPAPTVPVPLPK